MKNKYISSLVVVIVFFASALGCGTVQSVVPTATPPPESTPTLTAVPSPTITATPAPNSIEYKNPKTYRVDYVITVFNKSFTLNRLLVYLPKPGEWDNQKNVTVVETSPSPVTTGKDPVFGNGMYFWQIENAPKAGESMQFKESFTFTAYETVTTVDPDKIQPYNQDDALYKLYTRPEQFIESADPQIVALANQIAGDETNPYLLARKFYDYVVATAHYRLVGKGLLGAKALLTNGEGECGDFSSLFIALARAKGIPARPVVGYWAISGTDQNHVWAEFYLENIGWIPVDPTIGQSQPAKHDYYFGSMDNQRVILSKGFNIPLNPPTSNSYVTPLMQTFAYFFWGSSGDANTVGADRTLWNVTPNP